MVCFSCDKAGHGVGRCPELSETFPFMLPGWTAEKVGQLCHDLTPEWQQNVAGLNMETDPGRGGGGGSAAQISNGILPQDPSGGEVHFTSSRGKAMARPVLEPAGSRSILQSGDVRVSAVSVDATRKRVDQPVSTIPDSVDVDSSVVLQRDGQAQSGSGLPLRGGGGVLPVWIVVLLWSDGRPLRS